MNAKATIVTLRCESLGVREFEITHAERVLNMKPNGGWELDDDNYELTADGTIERRAKKEAKRASKGGDKE